MSLHVPDPRLVDLGWTPFFHQQWLALASSSETQPPAPERVVAEHRSEYVLLGSREARHAVLSGKLRHEAPRNAWPAVGDWVLASASGGDLGLIEHVFDRKTWFVRKESGRSSAAQPIAANVDIGFVVTAMAAVDADPHALRHGLSLRRVERYVRALTSSGAEPVVLVNKADLRVDAESILREVRDALPGVDLIPTSAATGVGVREILTRIGRGDTAVLAGSSGVGKSSLVNCLVGNEAQRVFAVREADTRGRHTTTHRELFPLPSGGWIVDTPGMREFGLWADEDAELAATGFDAIDELAQNCRFGDCRHDDEPGCAVRAAVENGELDRERVLHARQLMRELERQQERRSLSSQREAKRRMRVRSKEIRSRLRAKGQTD